MVSSFQLTRKIRLGLTHQRTQRTQSRAPPVRGLGGRELRLVRHPVLFVNSNNEDRGPAGGRLRPVKKRTPELCALCVLCGCKEFVEVA